MPSFSFVPALLLIIFTTLPIASPVMAQTKAQPAVQSTPSSKPQPQAPLADPTCMIPQTGKVASLGSYSCGNTYISGCDGNVGAIGCAGPVYNDVQSRGTCDPSQSGGGGANVPYPPSYPGSYPSSYFHPCCVQSNNAKNDSRACHDVNCWNQLHDDRTCYYDNVPINSPVPRVPEMSDYLAVLFVLGASAMVYHIRKRKVS